MISSETKIIHHSIIIHQPLASEKGKTAVNYSRLKTGTSNDDTDKRSISAQ